MQRTRPGGVTLIVVVGATLGILGTCGGAFAIFGQVAQDQLQGFSREMAEVSAGNNDAMLNQQLELQERLEEVTASWRVPIILHQTLNLLTSLGILISCILLFRWNPRAGTAFMIAAVASLVVDLGGGVVQMLMQGSINEVTQEYMADVVASDPNMPPGMDRTMGAAMTASTGVGMCFGVVWLVAKGAYYVGSLVYLRKDNVRKTLEAPAS